MIDVAIEKLRSGEPVLIFDFEDRECEVDIVFRASMMTPEKIRLMRKIAGGLICFVTTYDIGRRLGLELHTRLLAGLDGLSRLVKKPRYGDEPAFSIWVNHVNVKTGIRDVDRALTIRELSKIVKLVLEGQVDVAREEFYTKFYAPGHVPVLLGRVGSRWGHTELSLILSNLANIEPALVICEVLNDSIDVPSLEDCRRIAEKLNTVLISGRELYEIYLKVVKR
ncbi:MAG: 3,4-dihydroxy-2-butanone 4-phosphate synthase [Crenarchaeota archaeon]|nr:3,4-dihydroxy-2-butanone 4-phosphate synthase [Thermoproteota archaeon]